MTNLLPAGPPRTDGKAENSAGVCVEDWIADAGAVAVPGDELLRYLPGDRRSSRSPTTLAEAAYEISGDRLDRLSRFSASLGGSREAFLLTAFATLLARLSGQEAVTLRNLDGGPTVLTLAFDAEASFRSLFTATLRERAVISDQPCAVEFVSAPRSGVVPALPGRGLRMTVEASDTERQVRLTSTTGLWDQAVLRLWLRYFDRLLLAAANAPGIPWKTLPLLDSGDAQQFYRDFNETAVAFPADACVHELVMRQVERTPDAVAIASESRQYTYRQLDEASHAIAHRLQALGAGPGRPVAVCMERTAELPGALLGVLKAGCCYVPLDPQDPPHRLLTILEECRPAAIIADRSFPALPGRHVCPVLYPESIPEPVAALEVRAPGVGPAQQAYTIYTSGTTGKPKGVTISHRALCNLLFSMMRKPGLTSLDRMLAISSITFDIATMDMFLPLVGGGTLVVADRFVAADPFRLAELLTRFSITVLQATPATWRLLESSGWEGKHDLKMISGGEALPRDLANRLLGLGAELWNCYGPTETTIYSGALRIHSESGMVPIGPPIANTTFYVLDDTGRLLPPGVPGELYIGGTGVSSGYVDRPQITKQRFVPDPYSRMPDARMFRSGDLVRLVNEHEFEFLGRLDHQIKLRGYRIEPGEIESLLRLVPGVDDAVVVLREDEPGEPYLIAYVTISRESFDLRHLRDRMSQLLPSYMVPSRFVKVEAMPLTSSGKTDRKALRGSGFVPVGIAAQHQAEEVTPQTALEAKLLTIFREVLNTTEFGVTDSFFEYGGYSLLTAKLFTRIKRALNLALPISLLFDAPTVRALAEIVDRNQALPVIVPIRPRGCSAPLFVIHSYLLYGVLPHMVEPDRPVYGVRELLDFPEAETVEGRAATYVKEILKVYPNGPLFLTGWCAAGSLTVEIGRQLRELDHHVGLVALFDAEHPGYRPVLRGHRGARLLARIQFHSSRLRGTGLQQKLAYFRDALQRSFDNLLEALFMHHRRLVSGLQRMFPFTLPDAVFNNTWSRVAAIQDNALARYPGKVMLFRAMDVPQLPGSEETLGWNQVVDDGVEVVFVPGDHESMFQDPNVGVFSKRLREALQLAE